MPRSTVALTFDLDAMAVLGRLRAHDGGVLTVCMHRQLIGRAHRVEMLAAFVERGRELDVRFAAHDNVAASL